MKINMELTFEQGYHRMIANTDIDNLINHINAIQPEPEYMALVRNECWNVLDARFSDVETTVNNRGRAANMWYLYYLTEQLLKEYSMAYLIDILDVNVPVSDKTACIGVEIVKIKMILIYFGKTKYIGAQGDYVFSSDQTPTVQEFIRCTNHGDTDIVNAEFECSERQYHI